MTRVTHSGVIVLFALFCAARAALTTNAPPARALPVAVDLGRDPVVVVEALEGMGPEVARRLVAARAHGLVIDTPADALLLPGVGARRLHRWHDDLVFPRESR